MPVTRSSTRPDSQQPSTQPYPARRAGSTGSGGTKKASKPPSNDIIVLSSDDDESPPKGTLASKKSSNRPPRKKAAAFAALPVPSGDVLEISSDEESNPKKSSAGKQAQSSEKTSKDLRRTIKKLQGELKRSEQLLASTSREVEELKHDRSSKHVLSGLEEHTLCEVCTLTMWSPYTLPECGHSFCENCLVDWFSTIQAQHMTANPQLDNNRAALVGQLHTFVQMVPNLHAYGPHGQNHVRALVAELRRHRPEYTCPSCRHGVLNKPVEDFRLKGLIKEIMGMMGETNSYKETSHRGTTTPFDHFFAAPHHG